MPGTPKQPLIKDPDTQPRDLAYWMGRVDATLGEMKTAINTLIERSEKEWTEIDSWRREVEERLQAGNSKFEEHERRLKDLEGKGKDDPAQKPAFGTWPWFRDKYLESFLIIVITVVLYKLIEIIIAHWTVIPTK